MKSKLIEKKIVDGQYGMYQEILIIDTDSHGRLLVQNGYGGENSMSGGAYRWRHGLAVKLHPEDTLEILNETEWNESTSLYSAVIHGYDNTRPILDWPGYIISKVAEHAK